MPSYINNTTLSFDGTVSTADFFSAEVSFAGNASIERTNAFFFEVTTTTDAVMAITLQFNPDPAGESKNGWQDLASTDLKIRDVSAHADLAQQDAGIASNALRGGVITGTGVYPLLFQFTPLPYSYRLRFQIDSSIIGSIPNISFTQGR